MYNVYEKSFPHNNLLYQAETEKEAIDATSYFSEVYKIVFYEKLTAEQLREQINHEANIFVNSI